MVDSNDAHTSASASADVVSNTVEAMDSDTYHGLFLLSQEKQQKLPDDFYSQSLKTLFAKRNIPTALLTFLRPLWGQSLHFAIDDSGSMVNNHKQRSGRSDMDKSTAHPHVIDRLTAATDWLPAENNEKMLRWEAVESHLHYLVDLLAYVPFDTLTLSFFNRQEVTQLRRAGQTAQEFLDAAHQKISALFATKPHGGTPTGRVLETLLKREGPIYIFTDGQPDGGTTEIEQCRQLITDRQHPDKTPIVFLSCTDDPEETAWCHDMRTAPCVSDSGSFPTELEKIRTNQSSMVPYTLSTWLLETLVAPWLATDPLMIRNKVTPFYQSDLSALLGRTVSDSEYQNYLATCPCAEHLAQDSSQVAAPEHISVITQSIFQPKNRDTRRDGMRQPGYVLGLETSPSQPPSDTSSTSSRTQEKNCECRLV